MVQQEYMVKSPRGSAYRFKVVVPEPPIVASRGEKTLALNADWLKHTLDEFLTRNKDYSGVVTYFSGYLMSLKTLGVISVVNYEEIPPDAEPPTSNDEGGDEGGDEPQPLWAAWQKV